MSYIISQKYHIVRCLRKMGCRSGLKVQVDYQGVRVVLFFINIGKGENWRLLVSTDVNIGFNKLMEVYKIRWTIEVFFYGKEKIMQSNPQKLSWGSTKHDSALHKHFA